MLISAIAKQRNKGEESFKNWSKDHDPEDIFWRYDPNDGTWGKYYPINEKIFHITKK